MTVEPLSDRPCLVVFGRESCSVTRRTLGDRNDARVRYDIAIVLPIGTPADHIAVLSRATGDGREQ